MPSARALRVIMRANFASSSPSASATTTATSFADFVTSARMASSTRMVWPGCNPSFDGACMAALRGDIEIGAEFDLAGLEPLEQQIERHDLGERCRVTRAVGAVFVQHRAGIGIDDDRRIGRRGMCGGGAGADALRALMHHFPAGMNTVAGAARIGVARCHGQAGKNGDKPPNNLTRIHSPEFGRPHRPTLVPCPVPLRAKPQRDASNSGYSASQNFTGNPRTQFPPPCRAFPSMDRYARSTVNHRISLELLNG